jgi:hypothetical protein
MWNGGEAHTELFRSDQKLCSQIDSGYTNNLWMLTMAVPPVSGSSMTTEVGSGCTKRLWIICDLQSLVVAVPTLSGNFSIWRGWQWLCKLSLEELKCSEVGSCCTESLWRFYNLQSLEMSVPTIAGGIVTCRVWQLVYQLCLEVLWNVEVGNVCTNYRWRYCNLQSLAVAVQALSLSLSVSFSGGSVTNRVWQWLYPLSLEVL